MTQFMFDAIGIGILCGLGGAIGAWVHDMMN